MGTKFTYKKNPYKKLTTHNVVRYKIQNQKEKEKKKKQKEKTRQTLDDTFYNLTIMIGAWCS